MQQDLTLNLKATERPAVIIDGTSYGLRTGDEFSVVEFHRIGRMGRRLDTLMTKDEALTEAEELELGTLLDSITRQVLDAPEDLHARLRDTHRLRICQRFTSLLGLSPAPNGATKTGA